MVKATLKFEFKWHSKHREINGTRAHSVSNNDPRVKLGISLTTKSVRIMVIGIQRI